MFAPTVAKVNAVLMLQARPPLRLAEIGRLAGTIQTVTESALHTLEKRSLIIRTRPHGHDLFAPSKESPYYPAALLTALVDLGLRRYLPADAQVLRIYVFGSVPEGRATTESDLDVLIVGKYDERSATKALGPVEDTIGRPIDVVIRTTAEVEEARAQNDVFITRALAGICVWRSS